VALLAIIATRNDPETGAGLNPDIKKVELGPMADPVIVLPTSKTGVVAPDQ